MNCQQKSRKINEKTAKIFCGLMIKYYICIGINDKQLLIWKQGNTMLVQVEAVGAFGMRTETRLLASLPAR